MPQAPPSLHLDAIPIHYAGLLGMPRHAAALQAGGIPVCSAGALGALGALGHLG
ncbi:MAG: hypothetical protein ACI31F_01115 [Muribaculaceae bacterium]